MAGALVVVRSNSLQGEQSTLTDDSGFYRLPNLPPGTYTVQIFHGSYLEYRVSDVALHGIDTIRVNGRLRPTGSDERDITVAAPSIDVGSSSVGATVDQEFLRRVPIMQPNGPGGLTRSFEAVATVSPGAMVDTRGVSLAGATSAENNYQVDGMSVGSPRVGVNSSPLSVEFVEEVTVVDGGYMPEFGRSLGGTVSATTKSGGNEIHGSAWVSAVPGALGGIPQPTPTVGNALAFTGRLQFRGDAGATLGGPIVKDRLWYFVGFQAAQERYELERQLWVTPEPGGPAQHLEGYDEQYESQYTTYQALAKLTYSANPDHKFSVTGIYLPGFNGTEDKIALGANLNGTASSRAYVDTAHVADVSGRWLASADNKRWTFDTSLGWHGEYRYHGPNDKARWGSGADSLAQKQGVWSPTGARGLQEFEELDGAAAAACEPVYLAQRDGREAPGVHQPCAMTNYVTGGVGEVTDQTITRFQLQHTTSRTFEAAGHHTAKFGVDLQYISFYNEKGMTGGSQLIERDWGVVEDNRRLGILVAPDEVVEFTYMKSRTTSPLWGGFLQDSWNIADRFTLNAGVRYDGQFITANDRIWASVPMQIAPRAGFVFDPTQEGRSKIFGSFARSYQGLMLEMAEINGQIESKIIGGYDPAGCDEARLTGDSSACTSPENTWSQDDEAPNRYFGTWGSAPTVVDPNLRPASTDEILAGLEYEVFDGLRTAAGYKRRWLNRVIEDMSRDEAASYFLGNPGYGIATDFPKATRNYDAAYLDFEKRFAKHWTARANYTISWLRGNYSGLIKPEIDQLLPNITSDFDLQSLLVNRTGPLPNDHRHRINAWGSYEFELGQYTVLTPGLSASAVSGAPISYLGAHDLYGPYESFLLERGAAGRTPWVFDVSASLFAKIKLGDTLAFGAGAEVYNVANWQAVTAVDQAYTYDSSVAPQAAGSDEGDLEQAAADAGATINPNFGLPTAFQSPRAVRFSVRFDF